MMGVNNNNLRDKDFQQKQIMMTKKNYIKMYYGFVSINWGMGKTLGMSWQKALEQMDGFVMTKTKISGHPMAMELVKIHTEFRHKMAKFIMTNPYTDIKLRENHKKLFTDYGTKRVKESKTALDALYKQHTPIKNIDNTRTSLAFQKANRNVPENLQQFVREILITNGWQRAA